MTYKGASRFIMHEALHVITDYREEPEISCSVNFAERRESRGNRATGRDSFKGRIGNTAQARVWTVELCTPAGAGWLYPPGAGIASPPANLRKIVRCKFSWRALERRLGFQSCFKVEKAATANSRSDWAVWFSFTEFTVCEGAELAVIVAYLNGGAAWEEYSSPIIREILIII